MSISIKQYLKNGIFYSKHAIEKMRLENITKREILEVIIHGEGKIDYSKTDRSHAWNKKAHISITYNNLTIIACQSAENGILIISCYHGKPHDYFSNPYNRRYR